MEINKNKHIGDEEIDMSAIAGKLIGLFLYPFRLLAGHLRVTLAFVVLGLITAVCIRYGLTQRYESSFIIKPTDGYERFHVKILNEICQMQRLKDHKSLSRELKLEEADLEAINKLEVVNSPGGKIWRDSINCTEVRMSLYDNSKFLKIQTALINYLENNVYFAKVKKVNTDYNEKTLGAVNASLLRLDSLQRIQLDGYNNIKLSESGSVLLKDVLNPTSTYTLTRELFQQKMELIARTSFQNNFELVKSAVEVEKASWPPRLLLLLALCLPAALALAVIFLLLKKNWKGALTD